ncbi:uncharacterized protein PAC_10048 [Phialocephala subalpina]|uniref:Uncharacterized protein n=1 Tax=Phialocephala subalpina TaxID=576137 RepID=A0A1L7X559_9HELO|nr:uncharacterized protein PAC_10048 [Phialocephala subalpina]
MSHPNPRYSIDYETNRTHQAAPIQSNRIHPSVDSMAKGISAGFPPYRDTLLIADSRTTIDRFLKDFPIAASASTHTQRRTSEQSSRGSLSQPPFPRQTVVSHLYGHDGALLKIRITTLSLSILPTVVSFHGRLSCLSSEAKTWWERNSDITSGITTEYSLGPIVCPQAYTTVKASEVGVRSTPVACYCSDYKFVALSSPGSIGECTSPLTSAVTVTYMMESTRGDTAGGVMTTSTTITAPYFVMAVLVNGMMFDDIATSTVSSTDHHSCVGRFDLQPSTPSTGVQSNTSLQRVISGVYSPTSTPTISLGLSTDAKIGIGIGIGSGTAFLLVVGLLAFLLLARRQSIGSMETSTGLPQHRKREWNAELHGTSVLILGVVHEKVSENDARHR